jgi:hypothetical protein
LTWASAWTVFALLACNEDNDPGGVEDKDGVNKVQPGDTNDGTGGEAGGIAEICAGAEDCDDEDPCTVDECIAFNCRHTAAGDDGNACTFDVCDPGTGMTTSQTAVVVFSEAFADNAAMWTLQGQWNIGPTVATTGALDDGDDPATDHTATMDNGVAQTGAGALVNTTGGVAERLRSPAIDVPDPDPADFYTLRFWRWLNSDAAPIMTVTVEATAPTGDVVLWTNQGKVIDAPPRGIGWFEVRIDVTDQVRAQLDAGEQPSFSWTFTKNGSAQSVGGWAIDDVTLEKSKVPVDDQLCTLDTCSTVDGMAVAVATPMPAVDDGIACSVFVCDAGSFDNPQQQESTPDCFP